MMERINISLTEEQLTNVRLLAELSGVSISGVIRRLLDKQEKEIVRAVRDLEKRGGFL